MPKSLKIKKKIIATNIDQDNKIKVSKKIKSGPCIFPFIYKSKTYNNCINTKSGKICATQVDEKKNLLKYGFCPNTKKKKKNTQKQKHLSNNPFSRSQNIKENNLLGLHYYNLLIDNHINPQISENLLKPFNIIYLINLNNYGNSINIFDLFHRLGFIPSHFTNKNKCILFLDSILVSNKLNSNEIKTLNPIIDPSKKKKKIKITSKKKKKDTLDDDNIGWNGNEYINITKSHHNQDKKQKNLSIHSIVYDKKDIEKKKLKIIYIDGDDIILIPNKQEITINNIIVDHKDNLLLYDDLPIINQIDHDTILSSKIKQLQNGDLVMIKKNNKSTKNIGKIISISDKAEILLYNPKTGEKFPDQSEKKIFTNLDNLQKIEYIHIQKLRNKFKFKLEKSENPWFNGLYLLHKNKNEKIGDILMVDFFTKFPIFESDFSPVYKHYYKDAFITKKNEIFNINRSNRYDKLFSFYKKYVHDLSNIEIHDKITKIIEKYENTISMNTKLFSSLYKKYLKTTCPENIIKNITNDDIQQYVFWEVSSVDRKFDRLNRFYFNYSDSINSIKPPKTNYYGSKNPNLGKRWTNFVYTNVYRYFNHANIDLRQFSHSSIEIIYDLDN